MMAASKKPRRSKPTTRAEFLALEQEAWTQLTSTWHGLPDKVLACPGACGPEWSIKDVMNHIAAWQEAALQVLPELLQGHKLPAGQYNIAKFNALHHAEDKQRTVAASQRRLNRSRRGLLTFLASMPETPMLDLKGRAGTWVKYATYGHYDEHLGGLQEFRQSA